MCSSDLANRKGQEACRRGSKTHQDADARWEYFKGELERWVGNKHDQMFHRNVGLDLESPSEALERQSPPPS